MSIVAHDCIAHHARISPGREAIHDLASGRRLNYRQFDTRISRLALYLQSLGVDEGDRVAVLSHNDPDVFEIQFAWALPMGCVFFDNVLQHMLRPCSTTCKKRFRIARAKKKGSSTVSPSL